MSLYQKGFLAFAAVILIAVVTVALLVGQRTTAEFRNYTALNSNRAQNLTTFLTGYYAAHESWDGVQVALEADGGVGSGGQGRGSGNSAWSYRVADTNRIVVANSDGDTGERLSQNEIAIGIPLVVQYKTVGYLLPDMQAGVGVALDASEQQFLTRVRSALLLGGGIAFVAALLLAGLLTRGILAPVRGLAGAAENIAHGDLTARAPARGRDEIAQLATTFNAMAGNLQQAEEARQAQTADIAHELRNPLAVLQGTLEALADDVYEPTPENIQPALDQVHTLNRLVDDLRTLALADAGQLHLDRQTLDVGQLVARVVDAHRVPFVERGLALDAQIADGLPHVEGDYARLTQVLNNVLGNALRYVPAGGRVVLAAVPEDGGVMVRVSDNGPGVPADALPHLFDRFWRGDPSRSRDTGGSGLGLAIAQHIIAAHAGRIWAEATPGGGLTIIFWLST